MVASSTVSDPNRPIVAADGYCYAYPGGAGWVLRDIALRVYPGECHLLEGPTGSGKTTLLMAIRGLLPPGRQAGTMRLSARASDSRTALPGLLLQNPKTQLLGSSLGADVAFGLENHCMSPADMPPKVRAALDSVGLAQPFERPVEALSMGQQYRACLAGMLVMDPPLVMLDEPMAQLDPRGQDRLLTIVRNLMQSGRAVLICDHRPHALAGVADHFWTLDASGRLRETRGRGRPVADAAAIGPTAISRPAADTDRVKIDSQTAGNAAGETIVRVEGLQFDHPDGKLDLSALSFQVLRGERIVIHGSNGAGKTTLVECLSGLRRPLRGTVNVFGRQPRLKYLRGKMTVLFQDPRRQLFETTVFDEVAFAVRRSGRFAARAKDAVPDILDRLRLSHLSGASPHRLSYGQKHLVGLAAVLAARPELLILDDPFAGLDAHCSRLVMDQVAAMARAWGTTVIWTTHDPWSVADWADRVIALPDHDHPPSPVVADMLPGSTTKRPLQLGTGIMLGLCLLLSMSAFAARSPVLLAVLSGLDLLLLVTACPTPVSMLRKSLTFFIWQAAMIVVLYMLRFGITGGIAPGLQVAWQLFLALWPGMIFMAANAQAKIVATLGRMMPPRTAFVAATCLRFLPMLLSEVRRIRAVQALRGAGLLAGDLKRPRFWPDWIHCLLVPVLIKTLSLASDIAIAATARDFGIQPKRTAWPGE